MLHNLLKELEITYLFTETDLTANIYIYGLGTSGRIFADLCQIYNVNVEAYLVGNGLSSYKQYKAIAVKETSEMTKVKSNSILMYSVKQSKEHILEPKCAKIFDRVIDISSNEIYGRMLILYYKHYFQSKSIIFEKNLMKINNFNFLDVLQIQDNDNYRVSYLGEIGDILLPSCLNDFSRIDEGTYEDGKVKIERGDIVVDCGANLGVFSALAAQRGAYIYAFEPMEELWDILYRQSKLYDNKIKVEKSALVKKSGEYNFYCDEDNISTSSIISEVSTKTRRIKGITLDEFVKEKDLDVIDFIKADIEGGERDMLIGAQKVLSEYSPKLAICTYHRPDDPAILEAIIKEANKDYVVYHKWKKLYAYNPKKESV